MTRLSRLAFACCAFALAAAGPLCAETLHVVGAGSLTNAFSDLLRRFPAGDDLVAKPVFGPSGLMRESIEKGLAADVFASADMGQARRLAARLDRPVVLFTRNRLCAIGRVALGLTPENVLERMLDPKVRLATSTPGADPGGDYAFAVFARAEAIRPGAKAALEAKAQKLVGGGDATPLLVPGKGAVEGVFLADRADMMLGYCSGAAGVLKEVPGLSSVALPPALSVGPAYGMAVLNDRPLTLRFSAFVMSEAGQAVLKAHGFDPVGVADEPPAAALVVRAPDGTAATLAPERLAALPAAALRTPGRNGGPEIEWQGPTLWSVLVESRAADPAAHADHVRRIVRVVGSDGYVATFGLAELSPDFAGKPILLALRSDGKPLPPEAPRLVVPGETRAGRSVRDVVRIEVR